MALMTVFLTLAALLAVGVAVMSLALLESLFAPPEVRQFEPSSSQAMRLPMQFDVEGLRRTARAEAMAQSA